MSKKLIVYCCAWLEYVPVYKKYIKPNFQEDLKKLEAEGYEIYEVEREFDMKEFPVYTMTGNMSADVLLKHLRRVIRLAIELDALVFMSAPDIIYGENTVYNMVKLAEGKGDIGIAVPHLRISREKFLNKYKDIDDIIDPEVMAKNAFTNKELVNLCFDYPHPAFTRSFDNIDSNATDSGISIRKLSENDYCLTNCMPTVHLIKFNKDDLNFWERMTCAGHWDRDWLYMLYLQDRVKVVGSSDICFGVELTSEYKNVPPLKDGLLNNDKLKPEEHPKASNDCFRKFYFSLRRE